MVINRCHILPLALVGLLCCSLSSPFWTNSFNLPFTALFSSTHHKIDAPQQAFPTPTNLDSISSLFNLSPEVVDRLLAEGVIVLGNHEYDELGRVYSDWAESKEIPTIVTTDAWLHIFHVAHEDILKSVEEDHLVRLVETLVHELQNASITKYEEVLPSLANMTEAAYQNVVYFSVACRLLNDTWPVPAYALAEVQANLTKIYDASLVQEFPGEDYTQYKPRGHYAGNPTLEKYFRSMKWLSRGIFLLVEDPLYIRFPTLTARHLRQAVLFSEALRDNFAGDLWSVIYNVTAQFAGYADSVTPLLVQQAVNQVFGPIFSPAMLETQAGVTQLQEEFRKEIYPQPEILPFVTSPYYPKYAQVMGERFIPDSAAFQQTVWPHIETRTLPTALEAMYTMLGSERALELITEQPYVDPLLEPILRNLHADVETRYTDTDWHSSVYMNWLHVLSTIVQPFNDSYPAFMNTTIWLDEKLNTALGSYTQLRHDYILYAKQGVTPFGGAVAAIAEPIPEFYSQLHDLFFHLHNLLLDTDLNTSRIDQLLSYLLAELAIYPTIAQKIKDEVPLTTNEIDALVGFGNGAGTYGNKEPMLIADIWTDSLTESILEEGVGRFNPLLIIHEAPNSDPLIYVGLVFSHYEFTIPWGNRLTDQEWQDLLLTNPPERPWWTDTFLHFEFEDYLQKYDRVAKWQLPNLGGHISDLCFDNRNTFYLSTSHGDIIRDLHQFNASNLEYHKICEHDVDDFEFWNSSLYGPSTYFDGQSLQNVICQYAVNGTLINEWSVPSRFIDLTVDTMHQTIIAATSSTPIFYEYSTQGILLRTWGELGTNENQFYYIRSVYAEDGCLSVADNHFGITLLNLSTTQIITRFTSPSGPSECFQLFHTPNGDFFYLDSNNLVYKLSNSGQKLTRWTEPDENKDSTIGSMIPLNATHLALAVEQIDQITGNTSYHIAIYGFNHSRPSRPTVTPLNQTHPFQNLTLTWTPSIDLDGTVNLYQFELALDPGFIHLVDSGDTPDPSFFFEFLENDTIFFFRVRAQDNDQWFSSWSPTVSTRILVTSQPPDLPPALFLETLIALIIILPLIGGLSLLIDRKSRGTK